MKSSKIMVLVTGASGFIAMHCILQLLERGYQVRGTLRKLDAESKLRKTLLKDRDFAERIEFVAANLLEDRGWDDAVHGCSYVLHIASPFPKKPPKDEKDVINPAQSGTLRVLMAAASSGVKRVVMTSSIAAIVHGHDNYSTRIFDENDWSSTERDVSAYEKSKVIAEKSAWNFMNGLRDEGSLELSVINPGMVYGPLLNDHYSSSGEIVRRLMLRQVPGCPDLGWPAVDVRDVATAHIAAMEIPEAAGKRFCCAIENCRIQDIAQILAKHFRAGGYKIPTRMLPSFLVRLRALFDKTLGLVVKDLGRHTQVSNDRIKSVLDWKPRSLEEMIVSMGESMIEHGIV